MTPKRFQARNNKNGLASNQFDLVYKDGLNYLVKNALTTEQHIADYESSKAAERRPLSPQFKVSVVKVF